MTETIIPRSLPDRVRHRGAGATLSTQCTGHTSPITQAVPLRPLNATALPATSLAHMLAHEPLADPIRIETFKAEVRSWTDRIGLEDVPIQVRPMTHGWVTCSSRGRLSFDAQLLSQPQAFRGEVILFALLELLQRRAPPHGALFHTLPQSHEERR